MHVRPEHSVYTLALHVSHTGTPLLSVIYGIFRAAATIYCVFAFVSFSFKYTLLYPPLDCSPSYRRCADSIHLLCCFYIFFVFGSSLFKNLLFTWKCFSYSFHFKIILLCKSSLAEQFTHSFIGLRGCENRLLLSCIHFFNFLLVIHAFSSLCYNLSIWNEGLWSWVVRRKIISFSRVLPNMWNTRTNGCEVGRKSGKSGKKWKILYF